MVIGTDRLEMYEFLARRKEVLQGHTKQLLKLCLAFTVGHAIIVQIPTLFSQYFGDEVSDAQKTLGSVDKSEMGLRMSRMKQQANKRNEL